MSMICPNCGAEINENSKFCEYCGAKMQLAAQPPVQAETAAQLAETAGTAALVLGKAARRQRLEADYTGVTELSGRAYNLILCAVVLWGLLVNAALCYTVGDIYRVINPILFFILYFVLVIAGSAIAAKSHNPLVSFLGYNMIVVPLGLVLSTLVYAYGGVRAEVVGSAFVYTALVCAGMLCAVLAFPELFQRLGGALLGCLMGVLLCEVVLLLFGVGQRLTDWIVAGLFSLYIGYDIYRSQQFVKTVDNAVDCALDIYLDIVNLFIRLLRILGRSERKR